nr:uncharacterized protein LOC105060353 isoform X2 [Elaeis guineensis]XP_029116358.1 uncharacterized protein LOC105060353 isoform X2 [Elaeis guineensis]
MICVRQATSKVTFAAAHALSKMQCSASIASRAYKAGKQLLLGSLQDELKAEMLSSLSKLTFKSTTLIAEQVDLLLSFVSHDSAASLKARALKCLSFLTGSGVCCVSVNRRVLSTLIHIVDDNDIPVDFQCEALRILCKIFRSMCPDMHHMDLPDLFNLVLTMKHAAQTSDKAKRGLALCLLVDILCSIKKSRKGHGSLSSEMWQALCSEFHGSPQATLLASCGDGLSNLVCQVTLLIIYYISSAIEQTTVESNGEAIYTGNLTSDGSLSEVKECKSFLRLILHLAEEYPSAGLIALDRIRYLIQTLDCTYDKFNMENTSTSGEVVKAKLGAGKLCCVFGSPVSDNLRISLASKLVLCMLRFANACLNIVNESGAINSKVCEMLKLLAEYMQNSRFYDCNSFEIFCLCMHAYIACCCFRMTSVNARDSDHSNVGANLGFFHNVFWVGMERLALEFTKNMLKKRNYWAAYRVGKYSCCEGLWFAAAFTFRKLLDGVQSDSSHCWLKSLLLLAGGESEIKLLLFPKAGVELISGLQTESNCEKSFTCVEEQMGQYFGEKADLHDFEGKLARVYSRICSAEEILAASGSSVGFYYFHRWFISLRAKFLEILMGLLGLLSSHKFTEATPASTQNMSPLILNFALRLNKLAKDYDLLATSFLDIDCQSYRGISRLALSCSVLAFCSAFALHFSNANSALYKNVLSCSLGNSEKFLKALITKDIVERLWDMDSKITLQLQQFVTSFWEDVDLFQSRTRVSSGHIERASLELFESGISGVLQIQKDSKGVKDDEDLQPLFMRGLQLLSYMTRNLMEIPFQVPKYFFSVRPCVGAELFFFNADSRNKHDLSVSPGFQLSLNLCIQLKNAMIETRVRVAKMHCVLAVRPSNRLSIGGKERQMQCGFHPRKTDEMVELNEMLLLYIKAETGKADMMSSEVGNGVDLAAAYACFEPNEKGQGFSSCLLNVSAFPEGSYRIKWHSCCTDNSDSHWSLLPLNAGAIFTIRKP